MTPEDVATHLAATFSAAGITFGEFASIGSDSASFTLEHASGARFLVKVTQAEEGEPEHDPYDLAWPSDAEREIAERQGQDPNHRLYVPPENRIA